MTIWIEGATNVCNQIHNPLNPSGGCATLVVFLHCKEQKSISTETMLDVFTFIYLECVQGKLCEGVPWVNCYRPALDRAAN